MALANVARLAVGLDGFHAKGDRTMRLPDARRAEQDDVVRAFDETAPGEFPNDLAIN